MWLNPASIDISTGVITINCDIWPKLSPVQRKLLILHEKAHFVLQTQYDEIACDRWALQKFVGSEKGSIDKAINAYRGLLYKDYISIERKVQILKSIMEIDAKRFGNKRAEALLKQWKKGQGKTANEPMTIMAITAVASALVSISTSTIFGKRNEWAKGNNKKTTAARDALLRAHTGVVIGNYVVQYAGVGINFIQNFVNDRQRVQELVFRDMVAKGVFNDNSILTTNWAKKSANDFFKTYGWARAEINKYADEHWADLKKALIAGGHKNDIPGEESTSANWLLWGAIAIVGIILAKKILF